MQKDQDGIGDVLAADHHPLLDAAKTEISRFRDAAGEHAAIGGFEGWCLARVLHVDLPPMASTPRNRRRTITASATLENNASGIARRANARKKTSAAAMARSSKMSKRCSRNRNENPIARSGRS